jgi:hypothetical protein
MEGSQIRIPGVLESAPMRKIVGNQTLERLAIAIWAIVLSLLALTEISDPDLGRHVACGRLLLHDFGAVRRITFGQAPSILSQAYSYWLYEAGIAALWDHAGAAWIVLGRALLLLASFGGALAIAVTRSPRDGSRNRAGAAVFATGIVMSQERFLDRPELFSFMAWVGAIYILVRRRQDRAIWALIPLQILWVNTHLWFGLLPALVAGFAAGDALEGRSRWKRYGLLTGALVVASFVNPAGPGAWQSQFYLVQFLGKNYSLPFSIEEMRSPFSSYQPSPAVWVFRFAMPIGMLLALVGRKKTGWGSVFALTIAAGLGAKARRGMPLFGLTAIAILPAALADTAMRLSFIRARASMVARLVAGVVLVAGILSVWGLLSGRIFLSLDSDTRIGLRIHPRFASLDASRFIAREGIEGPLFCNAIGAGALVLENGTRILPFLDARWIGTRETVEAYQRLRTSSDATIASAWEEVDRSRKFQAVMLDFYEMPALLRHLSCDNPHWATVYVDATAAVLLRRGGPNEATIQSVGPDLLGTGRAGSSPDPTRDRELSDAVIEYLKTRKPSPFVSLRFPYDPFYRANYALQVRHIEIAQAEYLRLFREEKGALKVSKHEEDVLNNLFWCMRGTTQPIGLSALADRLAGDPRCSAERRRAILEVQARALEALGETDRTESIAKRIIEDPAASPSERWSAWCRIASVRMKADDWAGAATALRSATREMPQSPDAYRTLGAVLDLKLGRPAEALEAYENFRALSQAPDPDVEERIRLMRQSGGSR